MGTRVEVLKIARLWCSYPLLNCSMLVTWNDTENFGRMAIASKHSFIRFCDRLGGILFSVGTLYLCVHQFLCASANSEVYLEFWDLTKHCDVCVFKTACSVKTQTCANIKPY